jgi:hypothetical protein
MSGKTLTPSEQTRLAIGCGRTCPLSSSLRAMTAHSATAGMGGDHFFN